MISDELSDCLYEAAKEHLPGHKIHSGELFEYLGIPGQALMAKSFGNDEEVLYENAWSL